ncbi:MAG: mechanosensitive ion channel family protein [Treponema sp.]|nr:mechanosensitive ion channel family protein [Treponema sp.]
MELQNSIAALWQEYGQNAADILRKIILVLAIIIAGKIILRILKRVTGKSMAQKLKADETIISLLRAVIHYGVIIVCLIMILDVFGVSTTSLLALLGAAGVAVAFALRDTLGNIAAGIVIIFLRPFCKGDFIECDTVLGTVQEMGLFSTDLETADGIYVSVPNSNLWGLPLKNYSRNNQRRVDVTVCITYSDSIDTAFQVLREVIKTEPLFLKEPAPQVMVQALGESGIDVTLRAWVPSSEYWNIYRAQMKNVTEKIQAAGLTIALPQRHIHLIKDVTPDAMQQALPPAAKDFKEA